MFQITSIMPRSFGPLQSFLIVDHDLTVTAFDSMKSGSRLRWMRRVQLPDSSSTSRDTMSRLRAFSDPPLAARFVSERTLRALTHRGFPSLSARTKLCG
jgi:hypothetical protein